MSSRLITHRARRAVHLQTAGAGFGEDDEASVEQAHDIAAVDVDGRALIEVQGRSVAEQDLGASGLGAHAIADDERAVFDGGLAPALAVEKHLAVDDGQMRWRRGGVLPARDAGQTEHETRAERGEKACHWRLLG